MVFLRTFSSGNISNDTRSALPSLLISTISDPITDQPVCLKYSPARLVNVPFLLFTQSTSLDIKSFPTYTSGQPSLFTSQIDTELPKPSIKIPASLVTFVNVL